MRIEVIRLTNLNSLAGAWEIDLTDPVYGAEGIFAITGPTGAGKSTILDAAALALYGRTPRLDKVNKSENEIMTRGYGVASAEVIFSTGSGRYRAEWHQNRAHGKPEGALQDYTKRLSRETAPGTWEVLAAEKKAVVNAKIVELTGMDYDQFTRCVLLSQGDFAAFLKADADVRAATLEQLTGTEIYSRISIEVQQKAAAQMKALADLEERHNAVGLLTDEARTELAAQKEACAKESAAADVERKRLEAVIARYDALHKAETELTEIRVRQEKARAENTLLNPEREKLAAHRAAAPLTADARRAAEARQSVRDADTRAKAAQDAARTAQTQADKARSDLTAAKDRALKTQSGYERLLAVIPEVKTLDQSAVKLTAETEELRKRETLLKNETETITREIQTLQATVTKTQADLAAASRFVRENAALAGLTEALPGLSAALQSVMTATADQQKAAAEAQAAKTTAEEANKAYKAVLPQAEEAKKKKEALKKTGLETRERLTKLLDGKTEEALHSEVTAGEKVLGNLKRLPELLAAHSESRETQARLQKEKEEKARLLAQTRTSVTATEEALKAVETAVTALEGQLAALDLVARLKVERTKLTEGHPCPLCGATHHPWAHESPEADTAGISAQLKDQKTREAKLKTTLDESRLSYARLEAQCTELDKRLAEADTAGNKCLTALTGQSALCGFSEVPSADTVNRRITKLMAQQTAGLKRLTDIRSVSADLMRLRESYAKLEEKNNALTAQEASLKAQNDAAQKTLAEARKRVSDSDLTLTAALSAYRKLTAPYAEDTVSAQNSDALYKRLKDASLRYEKAKKDQTDLQAHCDKTTAEENGKKTLLTAKSQMAARASSELKTHTEELTRIQSRRRELFGAQNPDTAEKTAVTARDAAQKALAAAETAAKTADAEVTRTQTELKSSVEFLTKAQSLLSQMEAAWTALLAEKGFENEAAWASHLMTDTAAQALEVKIAAAEQSVIELTALLREKTAKTQELKNQTMRDDTEERVRQQAAEAAARIRANTLRTGELSQQLAADDERRKTAGQIAEEIRRQEAVCKTWSTLNALIGSHDGKRYREFVQGITFERLIANANQSLSELTDRYLLVRNQAQPLTLDVIDNWQAGTVRSAKNLSGGESFIVSLALALGLSRMTGSSIRVDSLFLDEGFGTLDEDALNTALGMLSGLRSQGKLIGVISHISQIRERIPVRIEVRRKAGGVSELAGPGIRQKAAEKTVKKEQVR